MSRKRRAGIAQLVEQATENRRVPSSNLGPGITATRSKQQRCGPEAGDRLPLRPNDGISPQLQGDGS